MHSTQVGSSTSVDEQNRKVEELEKLCKRELESDGKTHGSDFLSVRYSLKELAALYVKQGKHARAEAIYSQLLEHRKKSLGPIDWDELVKDAMADELVSKGVPNARQLMLEQRQAKKRLLENSPYPATAEATSLNEPSTESPGLFRFCATEFFGQGRISEAERMLALDLSGIELCPDYSKVAMSAHLLGAVYLNQKKYKKAEELFKKSIELLEVDGDFNQDEIAAVLNDLGMLYKELKDFANAEKTFNRSLLFRSKARAQVPSGYALTYNNLGWLFLDRRLYGRAKTQFERALDSIEKSENYEVDSNQLALSILGGLARLNYQQHNFSQAESFYRRWLEIKAKDYYADDKPVSSTVKEYISLLRETNREKQANELAKLFEQPAGNKQKQPIH